MGRIYLATEGTPDEPASKQWMNGTYLPAWVLQLVGVAVIVGSFAYWAISGNQSELFVGAGLTLCALGAYRSAMDRVLKRNGAR